MRSSHAFSRANNLFRVIRKYCGQNKVTLLLLKGMLLINALNGEIIVERIKY